MGRGVIVLFTFLFISQISGQQKYPEEYQKGMRALSAKDTAAAETFFRESISNYFDAPSHFQLGLLLNNKKDAKSRKAALYNLKKAADIEKTNLNYRLKYAEHTNDIEIIKKVIKDFPDSERPLIAAGKLLLTCYKYYKNLAMINENLKEWENIKNSGTYFNSGVEYLQFALKVAPSNPQALLYLAELYFYRGVYEKSAYYLIVTLSIDPKIKDAHLLYGMVLNRRNQIRGALAEFEKAFALMDKEEKDEYTFKSVIELLRPQYNINEKYDTRKEIEQLIQRFWKVYDPGILTDINERMVEHYARVAYACTNFSAPGVNLKGWQTERGEMYIRFGAPNSVKIYSAYDDYPQMEAWHYDNFDVSFGDYSNNSYPVLTGDNEENIYAVENSYSIYEEMKYTAFQDYQPKEKGMNSETQLFLFKNLDGEGNDFLDAYYIYKMPWDIINNVQKGITDYECSITLYDWEIEPVYGRTEFIRSETVKSILENRNNSEKINFIDFKLPCSNILAAFQIRKISDRRSYSQFLYYDSAPFPDTQVSVTVPVPASCILKDIQIPGGIKRKNLSFLPHLKNEFKKEDSLYVYFEVYGLTKEKNGFSNFEQEIKISQHKNEKSKDLTVVGLFEKIFHAVFGDSNELWITSSIKRKEENSQQFVKLDIKKLDPGIYDLAVTIKDMVTGKKTENNTIIEIK